MEDTNTSVDVLDHISDRVAANQADRGDYVDEDGLKRCGICHERKQAVYMFLGQKRIVNCICRCDQEEMKRQKEAEERRQFEIKVSNLKSVGLTESRFKDWCFANDNGKNQKLDMARRYVDNWQEMKEKNVGYLLMGSVGTGKSFFAGCIANALMEQGVAVMMTNFSRILNELTMRYADKNEIIAHLVEYPLLIIDDLGIERNSEFALEMIYNIVDRRYCTKLPLIVTTNLSFREMTADSLDTEHRRIYSRIMEMCVPILYDGPDQRLAEQDQKEVWLRNQFSQ